jgi:probable phosphomutase (TIGR03848 family)
VTTFCLVRHALTDSVHRAVSGRTPGLHLSAEGRVQADRLGEVLKSLPVSAIYSSPLERSVETAESIAARVGVPAQIRKSLTEVEYGDWTGREFSDLAPLEAWRSFNSFRSSTQIPGGESALAVQARAIGELSCLRGSHPGQVLILVSHAEVIRVIVCHYAGIPLDLSLRIEIEPASLSVIAVSEQQARIHGINLHAGFGALSAADMS